MQQYTYSSRLEIGRSVALGTSTLCGEVSIPVIHPCSFPGCRSCTYVNGLLFWESTLSSPDDGYFVYDLRPMSDQQSDKKEIYIYTRNFMFIFSCKTRSSLKFLTTKNFVQCYRVLPTFHRTDERGLQQTSSSIIIIAFEEMNDEASDTPCFTPRLPSASLSTITIDTETQSVC